MPAALDRLKKRSEFLAVAATNRRWTVPGLVLQARPYPSPADNQTDSSHSERLLSAGGLRVGFTATKKIGNAVKRNRARRRLRAAVSDVLKDANTISADLVLVARQGTVERDFNALKGDLSAALRRLGIVK